MKEQEHEKVEQPTSGSLPSQLAFPFQVEYKLSYPPGAVMTVKDLRERYQMPIPLRENPNHGALDEELCAVLPSGNIVVDATSELPLG